jgi:hypothetical protein
MKCAGASSDLRKSVGKVSRSVAVIVGRSGRRCLKFKFALKGVSSARPQVGC